MANEEVLPCRCHIVCRKRVVNASTWQRVRGRYWLMCMSNSSCWFCRAAASSISVETLGCPSTPTLSSALILAWESGTCNQEESRYTLNVSTIVNLCQQPTSRLTGCDRGHGGAVKSQRGGTDLIIAEGPFGGSEGRGLLKEGSICIHTCLECITIPPYLQGLRLLQVRQSLAPATTSDTSNTL